MCVRVGNIMHSMRMGFTLLDALYIVMKSIEYTASKMIWIGLNNVRIFLFENLVNTIKTFNMSNNCSFFPVVSDPIE